YNLTCCGDGVVELFGAITGSGGLTKVGGGTLFIGGIDVNTYAGVTLIESGHVIMEKGSALGSTTGGTVMMAGARLCVSGGISVYENITLNGFGPDGNGCLWS